MKEGDTITAEERKPDGALDREEGHHGRRPLSYDIDDMMPMGRIRIYEEGEEGHVSKSNILALSPLLLLIAIPFIDNLIYGMSVALLSLGLVFGLVSLIHIKTAEEDEIGQDWKFIGIGGCLLILLAAILTVLEAVVGLI